MSERSIFREAAIDRLSSPDQLDRLVVVTRPADWLGAAAIALSLIVLVAWGVLGSVPTRVQADGILVGAGGALVEATAGLGGRLARLDAQVGERVALGQRLATLVQPDIGAGEEAALALVAQRRRELEVLQVAAVADKRAEAATDSARMAGFDQARVAAEARATALARRVAATERLLKDGLSTQPELDRLQTELGDARQAVAEARNGALALQAERVQRDTRRSQDLRAAEFRVADAEREARRLGAQLGRESAILSPIAGRITEIKVSPGAVLEPGASVAVLETGAGRLQAVIYLPPDEGKRVRPGMRVRLEPSTVRRDEHGMMLGRVESVSPFPATPEGMAAALHNADLVARFRRRGAPYAAVVTFDADPSTPTGYRWTSRRGPPDPLVAGALVQAEVEMRRQRPIELLLPLVRRAGRGFGV
jgi:HlyD family secretion protein